MSMNWSILIYLILLGVPEALDRTFVQDAPYQVARRNKESIERGFDTSPKTIVAFLSGSRNEQITSQT
jgi:hypothetical protein